MSVGVTENINLSLGVNSIILRARPNKDCPRFTDTQELSIKPARYNTDFQRASTPRKTMFYGVYMSQPSQNELDIMRTTAAYETIPEIRLPNNPYSGKLTLGYWTNHEPLNLIAIMHKKQYTEINPYSMEVFHAYREHLANGDKNLMQKSIAFYDFLADEFSKKDIRGNYDYKISALFSEAASRNSVDGIIYPSVRLGGMSFNVALNELAIKKLKLDSVEEATVQQEGNNVSISINAFTKCNNQSTFKLEDVPGKQ
ncbi:hypothetical protein SAMN04487891_10399 [Flagellimonas taeanensis]|uniref:RES domain-containing protein n=2 Tax=Flagellimonas taeanensis TaxID=1005926 RepID=A0A1M6T7T2_9FLAO|nr:hypothetical protein SAMN04487891_10399 [Allomuricauda taeanensis]SHK53047.1 hypothetical protein SAMN05216293_1260 [Allomuricauda taeanensis]